MLEGKDGGIVKVIEGHGPVHAGMGLLIDRRHVVTCAHVVNKATGGDLEALAWPTQAVELSFPLTRGGEKRMGEVIVWHPMGDGPDADIAVLKLDSDAPSEAGEAILADFEAVKLDGDALSAFGIPGAQLLGENVEAEFKGPVGNGLVQLDRAIGNNGIVRGFSGGAVWDRPHQVVVGMIVAVKDRAGNLGPDDVTLETPTSAYMIPAAILQRVWPQLAIERRDLVPHFAWTWTLWALAVFILLFEHWITGRKASGSMFGLVLTDKHPQLAAMWGMIFYAVLAPVLTWWLYRYAKAYRLHRWPDRVPPLAATRFVVGSPARRTMSLATLICFFAVPLAAQIHFIESFHDSGEVYIYPDKFGFSEADLTGCIGGSEKVCLHKDAGRYSLVSPKAGSGKPFEYRDNAYHYGHENKGAESYTDTFFPILEPVLVLLLTAGNVLFLSGILLQLFFPGTALKWGVLPSLGQASTDSDPPSPLLSKDRTGAPVGNHEGERSQLPRE